MFYLKSYFIRKSHKHSRTIVLEAISPEADRREIYFSFDDLILFEEIYQNLYNCIVDNLSK